MHPESSTWAGKRLPDRDGNWIWTAAIAMPWSRHYTVGIELGMTPIDSAQLYGHSELVIVDAIEHKRDERSWSQECRRHLQARYHHRMRAFTKAVEPAGSIAVSCTGRGSYPHSQSLGSFRRLKRAGKARSWDGVSNFNVASILKTYYKPTKGSVFYI